MGHGHLFSVLLQFEKSRERPASSSTRYNLHEHWLGLQLPCCLQAEQVGAWEEIPGCVKLEVGSPRAFLCEDPRFLTRPISMRGHPKLWQLPPQILSRAAACLQLPPQVAHGSDALIHQCLHLPWCSAVLLQIAQPTQARQLLVQISSRPHAACASCGIQHSCTNFAATPRLPCEGWGVCEWESAKDGHARGSYLSC